MKTTEITIPINKEIKLKGNLNIPYDPSAFVIFSHGSGSSRFSKRNHYIAEILNGHQIATLLTDLLTEKEDSVYNKRFDIDLLTDRLIAVTNYATQLSDLKHLSVGYFGASTGAASALQGAARIPHSIQAIVSRGGRPDLAADLLSKVKAPTLLIVGGLDTDVIVLNKEAYSKLNCEKELRIVKGAGHLFEEPQKLDEVADQTVSWFTKYLVYNSITK
jgi:dienelactone hydrolase